jgi:uncharacterized protein YkwD
LTSGRRVAEHGAGSPAGGGQARLVAIAATVAATAATVGAWAYAAGPDVLAGSPAAALGSVVAAAPLDPTPSLASSSRVPRPTTPAKPSASTDPARRTSAAGSPVAGARSSAAPVPVAAPAPPAQPPTHTSASTCRPPESFSLDGDDATAVFDELNSERSVHNLAPLAWSSQLASIAAAHTRRMVQDNDLSHQLACEPDFDDRVDSAGNLHRWAENIGWNSRGALAVEDQFYAEGPGKGNHYDHIVDPGFTEVGIAVITVNGKTWLTEDFGQPM